MNENILFVFSFALLLLFLSKIGGRGINGIIIAPFILFCFLAFNEIKPIIYAEQVILYNDWYRYNGIIVMLMLIFLGGILEMLIKIFDIKINKA
jgi:hypothetical protein